MRHLVTVDCKEMIVLESRLHASIGVDLDHMHFGRRLEPAQLCEKALSDEDLGFLRHVLKAAGTLLRHVVHWGCAIVCWPMLRPGDDMNEVHLVTRPADSSRSGILSSLAQQGTSSAPQAQQGQHRCGTATFPSRCKQASHASR